MSIYSWIWLSLFFVIQASASDQENSLNVSEIWSESEGSAYACSTIEDFIYEKINTKRINSLPEMENAGLHVYAFNAGQSNAVCLTKEGKSVMIDGGADPLSPMDSFFKPILKTHLEKNSLQCVFITHAHNDHYRLFPVRIESFLEPSDKKQKLNNEAALPKEEKLLINEMNYDFSKIRFIVGGNEEDWKNKLGCIDKIEYYDELIKDKKDSPAIELNDLLPHVSFKILNIGTSTTKSMNSRSLIILVKDLDSNISLLFTGDAEGESVGRAHGLIQKLRPLYNLAQASYKVPWNETSHLTNGEKLGNYLTTHLKNAEEQFEIILKTNNTDNFDQYSEASKNFMISYQEVYNKLKDHFDFLPPTVLTSADLISSFKKNQILRILLRDSSIKLIFLPHHGTNTENSQRWQGLFSQSTDKIFVISSAPSVKNHFPKASTLEMIPNEPKQEIHPFLYASDNNFDYLHFRMTDKPVYLTGAEPQGVCAFALSKDHYLYKLDMCRRSFSDLENTSYWLPIANNLNAFWRLMGY